MLPGVPWQEGFCDGLVKSLIFIPIFSRDAINHPSIEKQNLTLLSRSSACDNVLLESRLALELRERNLLTHIYPILIGDRKVEGDDLKVTYSDYFDSKCHPTFANNVLVDSVEAALQDHLNRLCFGTPLLDNMFVDSVLSQIIKNQGCLIEGPKETAFDAVLHDVTHMVVEQKTHQEGEVKQSIKDSLKDKDKPATVGALSRGMSVAISYSAQKYGELDNISEINSIV